MSKFCSALLLLLLMSELTNAQTPPSVRGLYVDNFRNILGNANSETLLLNYAQAKGFNYLAFYDLHRFDFTVVADRNKLAAFIRRAKTNYGVTQVGAIGETFSFFNTKIITNYQSTRTDPLEKFDVLNFEFEYWNPVHTNTGGVYCDDYLYPNCNRAAAFTFFINQLTQIKSLCTTQNLICEAYYGWFDQAEANQFVPLCDRILIHSYITATQINNDPTRFYNYTKDRMSYIGIANTSATPKTVFPIFSSETDFSGPWLLATTPSRHPQSAYNQYKTNYDAETGTWKTKLSLVGYQWFAYTYMPEFNTVIPVELIDFKGKNTGKTNELTWSFAETNEILSIEIQKSYDGRNFTPLSILPKNRHDFTDSEPYAVSYYQLKINGLDGKTIFSKVISVNNTSLKTDKMRVFPNPSESSISIDFQGNTEGGVLVTNSVGQTVYQQQTSVRLGILPTLNTLKIDVSQWASGVYFIKSGKEVVKFVKN